MTDVDPTLGHRFLDVQDPDRSLGCFDLVLCCNVLEHVARFEAAVDGLASLCSDNGQVFASTPYVYPYHDEPNDFWRPTEHGRRFAFEQSFAEVEIRWTGLHRLPFQLFVLARRPT